MSDAHTLPTPAERTAVKEARKLSHVDEPVFEEYVKQTETPTKAGLLRGAQRGDRRGRNAPTR